MKGAEFLRRVRRLARRRGWEIEWRPDRGKGSHGLLIVNGHRTVLPNLKAELKRGLFFGLLRNLGLEETDLHND